MDEGKVEALEREILELPEGDRLQLARELLPVLLTTRVGLESIDRVLRSLSDKDLDALVERARGRGRDVPEDTIAAVIGEALRAVRTQSRS